MRRFRLTNIGESSLILMFLLVARREYRGDQESIEGTSMLKAYLFLTMSVFVVLNLGLPARSDDETEYRPEDGTNFSTAMHHASPQMTLFEGDKSLQQGKNAKALVLLKRAVEENDTDFDARVAYASALEKKYRAQVDKDPKLLQE